MAVKFISKEELDGIADALPTDFFNLSGAMQELEEKGITISDRENENKYNHGQHDAKPLPKDMT